MGVLIAPLLRAFIILPDVVAYVAIHLRFDTTWYVMTERSLRIRRGIWVLHETTITFENVQNVVVNQGPVQRFFGIANVVWKLRAVVAVAVNMENSPAQPGLTNGYWKA